MCCDSPSPPQPDPAIGQAAQTNAEIGREALAFQRQVYEESKPRQASIDALAQKVVDAQIGLSASAAERQKMLDQVSADLARSQIGLSELGSSQAKDTFQYIKDTYRPLEQSLVRDANQFDTEAKRVELAGRAMADVEQQAAISDGTLRRQAAAYGINPADGAFQDSLASASLNKTAAKINAGNAATVQARNEGRAFKFDVAALGRGLPAAGLSAAQVASGAGDAALRASVAPYAGYAAQSSALGGAMNAGLSPAVNARADAGTAAGLFGTAISGNSAAGNLYLGQYDAQMRGYNAQLQSDSSMFGGLGSLVGTAAGLYFRSSKDDKRSKKPVDDELILEGLEELPVEAWRYKKGVEDGGALPRIGPYAEDVNYQFGEGAAPGGEMIDAQAMSGLTLAGVKALAKKVRRIEEKVGLDTAQPRSRAPEVRMVH